MSRLTACLVVAFAVGCGGGGNESNKKSARTDVADDDVPVRDRLPWDPALGTSTIRGTVKFVGETPRRRPIDMASRPDCAKLHDKPVLDDALIVGPDAGLQNVYVWIRRGLESWQFPTPSDTVTLNQEGCRFSPHVLFVRVGQELVIRNSDPTVHNVHSLAQRNTSFNFTQTQAGLEDRRVFSHVEPMVRIQCDIHGWMSAFVCVARHPYATVTGNDGNFVLEKLPPGNYTLEAQHEILGTQTLKVVLGNGESQVVEFQFEDN